MVRGLSKARERWLRCWGRRVGGGREKNDEKASQGKEVTGKGRFGSFKRVLYLRHAAVQGYRGRQTPAMRRCAQTVRTLGIKKSRAGKKNVRAGRSKE